MELTMGWAQLNRVFNSWVYDNMTGAPSVKAVFHETRIVAEPMFELLQGTGYQPDTNHPEQAPTLYSATVGSVGAYALAIAGTFVRVDIDTIDDDQETRESLCLLIRLAQEAGASTDEILKLVPALACCNPLLMGYLCEYVSLTNQVKEA